MSYVNFIFFRLWATKDYVDNLRIGIWGWVRDAVSSTISLLMQYWQSYGGFMAAKVAEADAGVHTLAMSVAVRIARHPTVLPFIYFTTARD